MKTQLEDLKRQASEAEQMLLREEISFEEAYSALTGVLIAMATLLQEQVDRKEQDAREQFSKQVFTSTEPTGDG